MHYLRLQPGIVPDRIMSKTQLQALGKMLAGNPPVLANATTVLAALATSAAADTPLAQDQPPEAAL